MGIRVVLRAIGLMIVAAGLAGCQSGQPGMGTRLIAHVAMIDFSGLAVSAPIKDLKIEGAIPQGWESVPAQNNAMFVHRQWRSASHMTGVGVAYVHMPLPMSAKALLWFAKAKYSDKTTNGKLIGEWTDSIGREWFEVENLKYHVKGYAVTDGFEAWVVYSGYRLQGTPNPAEIGLAARAMDSIVPLPLLKQSRAEMSRK